MDYISFVVGFVTGISLWMWRDLKNNPYIRGYADGFNEAIKEIAEREPDVRDQE